MKKAIAVLAAATLCLTLFSACGGGGTGSSVSYEELMAKFEGEPEQNVTLKILDNDTAVDEGYFDELIAAFNAEYAEYGIKAEDANMSQYTDLETNGPLGYGPDVLYNANDVIMRYAENGHVLPLPTEKLDTYGEGKLDESVSATFSMNRYDMDLQFGVPINVQTLVLFYRADKFADQPDADGNGTPDVLPSVRRKARSAPAMRATSSSARAMTPRGERRLSE